MRRKLSEHKLNKGKFITPWNLKLGNKSKLQSWFQERLPEYIWLGLILDKYGRKEGLTKAYFILKRLNEIGDKDIPIPALSLILKLCPEEQNLFYSYISEITDAEVLGPLTLIYSYSKNPEFSRWFCNPENPLSERQERLLNILEKASSHQSEFATDIRFLVTYFALITGRIAKPRSELELILEYPDLEHSNEKMRLIRPSIRSTEICLLNLEVLDKEFLENFWTGVSKMSDCKLYCLKFPENESDTHKYIDVLCDVFEYLTNCFKTIDPLNSRTKVLLGISTFCYKRLIEIVDHNLFNTIVARSTVRTIIECFIMMKYLLLNESTHENIWDKYQYYGIGLYKVVLARSREATSNLANSHIDYDYVDILVNQYMDEEFIDMDTSYFDKQSIRDKATAVGEKDLYGLYYDYDSSYEHGLWGAIRESSLLQCDSPAHQFHCVPDYEYSQNLKDVWPDCIMIMNKIVLILNDLFSIPDSLLQTVMSYDQ